MTGRRFLDRLALEITTGTAGTECSIAVVINGHTVALAECSGSTAAAGTLRGEVVVRSHVHELVLRGPERDTWSIERIHVDFYGAEDKMWSVDWGSCHLEPGVDANLWDDGVWDWLEL